MVVHPFLSHYGHSKKITSISLRNVDIEESAIGVDSKVNDIADEMLSNAGSIVV